ncbi:phosphoribosyltransferase [Geodermatophilus obscurus]|uniref:Phosphoribosyltransferase n=1 Tax=Geodermatophilus obscurus (strain ATCC 25078 / DSM 43160 / JCM 3152 / CCUG 61914 / KCC A-0152 / KCTC 9177 / NBRC 13315 / NRRL B-3577 / G-20) TaxID=526225 RepID=D2SBX4_GEOOG|nr:phosphoribosyltransferase [Geodermatophilus obscurus]ADB74142.1 phosphoribosyltransferase [Geodermatophilus obscurus DSM 43160]
MTTAAHDALMTHFRWEGGHADMWRVFADAEAFAAVLDGLVEPWRGRGVTRVVGIESRGFVLGGATAVALGVGFVAIRKPGGLLPEPKHVVDSDADYRGRRHQLRMQGVLSPEDRVVLVDDWAEQGSQAWAARRLVESAGATFLGVAPLVDQLPAAARGRLGDVTAVARAEELGPAR